VLKPGVVVSGNNPRGQWVIEELVEGAVTKEIARVADGNAWLDGHAGGRGCDPCAISKKRTRSVAVAAQN